jgi:hypothetical protein
MQGHSTNGLHESRALGGHSYGPLVTRRPSSDTKPGSWRRGGDHRPGGPSVRHCSVLSPRCPAFSTSRRPASPRPAPLAAAIARTPRPSGKSGSGCCSASSAWTSTPTGGRASCLAGSSSGSRSPGLSRRSTQVHGVVVQLLFTPLLAGSAIWVGIAVSTRCTDVRAAQQLGVLGSFPTAHHRRPDVVECDHRVGCQRDRARRSTAGLRPRFPGASWPRWSTANGS